jgi:MFS family permease
MSPPGGARARAVLVVFACFVCQMGLGYQYVFGAVLGDATAELGLGRGEFATLAQLRNGVMALLSPLVGALVVRAGARPVLLASALVLGAAMQGLSAMRSGWELVVWSLVLGVGLTGVNDVTVGQPVSLWVRRRRGSALGVVYSGSNLAAATLVPAIAWLSQRSSWREALQSLGWVGAVALALAAGLVRSPRPGELDAAPPSAPLSAAAPAAPIPAPARDLPLRAALRTRSFWVLAFALSSYFAYTLAIVDHFATYLVDQGLSAAQAAAWWSTAILLGAFAKLAVGFASDRLPAGRGLAVVLALIALSSLLAPLAPGRLFLWGFVLSFGFAYAARDVVYPLAVIECFGVRYMAQIYGALMLSLLLGGVPGTALAGAVADRLGSYRPALILFAALNALAVAGLGLLRREHERAAAPV